MIYGRKQSCWFRRPRNQLCAWRHTSAASSKITVAGKNTSTKARAASTLETSNRLLFLQLWLFRECPKRKNTSRTPSTCQWEKTSRHPSQGFKNTTSKKRLTGEWSVERFDKIPSDWIKYLDENTPKESKSPVADKNYLYPPMVPEAEYQACLDLAINQNKSTIGQLDVLLSSKSPQLTPKSDTNTIAFTISDFGYVEDMFHEVFQMMDNVVGFSCKHFCLIAIDKQSAAMACNYGYSVVLWKADDNLKDTMANTKVIISLDLVKRGIDFSFRKWMFGGSVCPKRN